MNTTFFVGCLCVFFERINQKKKVVSFLFHMLVWKKKVRGDREKLIRCVLLFRVFEQKKSACAGFWTPIWHHATPAHVDTQGTKEKSAQQLQQQQQQHAIIILTKSRKVNNTTINAHHHHRFVGATDNRKFFFITRRVLLWRTDDPIFPEEP